MVSRISCPPVSAGTRRNRWQATLACPQDADVPGAVRVLQGGVHAPAAGALPLADAVMADVARPALRQSLFPEALPQRRVAAGVGVGDRHAPRQVGVEPDLQASRRPRP